MIRTIRKLQLLLAITVCSSFINLAHAQKQQTPSSTPAPKTNDQPDPKPNLGKGGSGGNGGTKTTACIRPVKKNVFINKYCNKKFVLGAIATNPDDSGDIRFAPTTEGNPNTSCFAKGNYKIIIFGKPENCVDAIKEYEENNERNS